MKKLPAFVAVVLLSGVCHPATALERVYLRSGSTLIAESHKDLGNSVEVILQSGTRVVILAKDMDKIVIETSAPIDLSNLGFDLETALPDVSDPLNEKWLDRPVSENPESARLFLSFPEQLERGFEIPLAKTLSDVNYARKRKVKTIEFIDRLFYLGMDMHYHEDSGIDYDDAFVELLDLESARSVKEVLEYIHRLRLSSLDTRKEPLIAAAIRLRDRLDPDYGRRQLRVEGWTAQVGPEIVRNVMPVE